MNAITTIRSSESGWIVYFNRDVNNFVVFRSDEPERFIKFITEKVAKIKVDQLLQHREAQMQKARESLTK